MDSDSDYQEAIEFPAALPPVPHALAGSWGLIRLFTEASLGDDLRCAEWCLTVGLLSPMRCWRHRCDRELVVRSGRRKPEWWCSGCRNRKSALTDTVFQHGHLSMGQILVLAYSWANGDWYEATKRNLVFTRDDSPRNPAQPDP